MSFNSISGKTFFEKINASYGQNKKSQDSAYENFAENLKEKAEQEIKQQSSLDATTAETFAEMVDQFEAFVEKRIKEGPPKIQIGSSEFSEEEWERLLKKIDEDIDAYKEELRERVRKRQEQEALQRTTGSAAEEISKMAGITETEHALPAENADTAQEPEVTETEAIEGAAEQTHRGNSFFARLSREKKAPYSYLADETGVILYKGVTFVCNDEKQQICLGDMSDSKNVITIPLAKGGCLKVNRDNIEDLAKAIRMFSPEDIGRIMRAIAQDSKVKQVEFEIDERTV